MDPKEVKEQKVKSLIMHSSFTAIHRILIKYARYISVLYQGHGLNNNVNHINNVNNACIEKPSASVHC